MSVVLISTDKGTHREEARSLSCLGRTELEKMAGDLTGHAKTKNSNFFFKKIASRILQRRLHILILSRIGNNVEDGNIKQSQTYFKIGNILYCVIEKF